ncbi:MAG: alpha-L-fucosidase [Lachnospiraceae bacterium]|nr:alpha-L-fucosidase [Lachnospiraceae bacterium]
MYDMSRYLETIEEVIARGPFQDNWASLSQYQVPEWYRGAKFGIFVHWGLYSIPAFGNEWYSRNMYRQEAPEYEHHRKTYGAHTEFGYKDFIPMFKAEHFDPDEWAELFAQAGAKYVVPVAEHHDGFQMYESEISHWNAVEMGPRRDILGELKKSCNKKGIQVGASSHRVEHWFFMGHGKEFDSDIKEPLKRGDFYWPAMPEREQHDLFSEPMPTEEFLQDWLVRCCELVDKYRPKIVYFDWWIEHSSVHPYLRKFAAYYYNRASEWGSDAVINYKHDAFMFGTAVPDLERGKFADTKPYFWQTDTSTALNSWGYTENNDFRLAEDLICELVDIVSKNGCLLLNVGPKADGKIAEEDRAILQKIGQWLKVNGEAIYDARSWRKYGEGPTQIVEGQFSEGENKGFTSQDFRFTMAGGFLYAIALKCSSEGRYHIQSLGEKDASKLANFHGIIKKIEVLGSSELPEWSRDEEALHIQSSFSSDCPVVFRIEME